MIIYTGTIKQFSEDVFCGLIADKLDSRLHRSKSEYQSWDHSLRCMKDVLRESQIDENAKIAIEYQIPATSKRVDFLVTGKDINHQDQVIIIELKQWEKASCNPHEDLVMTYLGGSQRLTTHPSYQAYSYAKIIENYNQTIEDESICLHPCAYLHNYKEEYRFEIDNETYQPITKLAPLYLKQDAPKLANFIKQYIYKADNGELLYKIENGRIRPSKALQDALVSMIHGNQEFVMIDEQKVAFSVIKHLIDVALNTNQKYTVIVEGGPGTGKSVIAINLLAQLKYNVSYVTKNAAPRNVYFHKLKNRKYHLEYIRHLFKSSGQFYDCEANTFDCLLVDEAHRLNAKSGLFQNKGENQIKEIINASRVSVFFIDEEQMVTTKDIGSITEIKKWAYLLNSKIYHNEDTLLKSQFRCNGSDGYMAFLDHLLGIKKTDDIYDFDYDFRIYDDLNLMREDLRTLNTINNKSRMVAGYCYEWITKNKPYSQEYDIVIGDFKAKWNFGNTQTWAIDEKSFDQVGCIHTSQGLEFDYIGVIIGLDLRFDNNQVITDYTKRAKTDQSLRGLKLKGVNLSEQIIRNTYKTLMSRGQKGCFVYCEDKNLQSYFQQLILGIKRPL